MNKKVLNLFFILIISVFFISAAYATDDTQINDTVSVSNNNHIIKSGLTNDDIQKIFDNSNGGDTLEFTEKEYKDISIIVDKKLNIISKKGSTIYASDKVSNKAKNMGITKTFGFYFTSNAAGSVLSGITIKAENCDNAIIVDGTNNITIKNNNFQGGKNSVLIKNSDKITLSNNKITKAIQNGVQLNDASSLVISKNTIYNNGRSGIETSNIHDCNILNNTIHNNKFNGISMYDSSSGNTVKYNNIHNNTNGIYINCNSQNDVILANTVSHNRRDPNCELGADESGNGILFGNKFRTPSGNSKLLIKNNALIHNEQFQAKNNPENPRFELDQNYFDSTDNANTFVCPMLLAKILTLDTITVKNGIGLQVKDPDGNPVTDMATFDVDAEVDGNKYVVTVENDGSGKILSEDIEPNTEYEVKITHGDKQKFTESHKVTSGEEKYQKPADSKTNNNNDESGKTENQNHNYNPNSGTGTGSGDGNGNGIGTGNGNSNSTNSNLVNSGTSGNYGSNSSDIYSSSSSDNGENALSNGDQNAGSSSEGSSGEKGNAYEIIPEKKISKSVVDTSGVVILSIIALVVMFMVGYRRKNEFE